MEDYDSDLIYIDGTSHVINFRFDDGYDIMVSDMSFSFYRETLNVTEIQERFHTLNPDAEMKPKDIVQNLSQCLKHKLRTKNNICFPTALGTLMLKLKFEVAEVPFTFYMQLKPLPLKMIKSHIMGPMIIDMVYNSGKYTELFRKAREGQYSDDADSEYERQGSSHTGIKSEALANSCENDNLICLPSTSQCKKEMEAHAGIKSEALPNRCENEDDEVIFLSQCKREMEAHAGIKSEALPNQCDTDNEIIYLGSSQGKRKIVHDENAVKTESSVKTDVDSEVPVSQQQRKKKKKA